MISKDFHISEFESRDGAKMPREVHHNILELVKNLQVIRNYVGKPLYINSGYRSPAHNKRIGGVLNSKHIVGLAADISVKGLSPKRLARIIRRLINSGKIKQGGLGLYNGFVHYDIRGWKARWDYSSLFDW